jgi:hypothetical protein
MVIFLGGSSSVITAQINWRVFSTSSTNPLTGHGQVEVSNTQEVYSQDHHQHPTAPTTVNAGAVVPTEAG